MPCRKLCPVALHPLASRTRQHFSTKRDSFRPPRPYAVLGTRYAVILVQLLNRLRRRLPLSLVLLRHRLGLSQDTENVLARQLLEIRIAPAPPNQLGEEGREFRDVFESVVAGVDAVEIAADADVIHPCHLPRMLDVV